MNITETGASRWLPFVLRLKRIFPVGVLACLAFGSIDPATADEGSVVERYSAGYTAGHADAEPKTDPLRSGPLFAVISLADQRISIYGSEGLAARARVSTGMRGHPTPTGVFSIVQKQRWHRSNIYSGAPMPLMQRITWSGIALHAGYVPGYPASHGCIRLPPSFAERLFHATNIGQRVIVVPEDATPIEITHKNLPAPLLLPPPGGAVSSAAGAPDETASVATARANGDPAIQAVGLRDAPASGELLNPLEFARALKIEANREARAAARANRAARLLIGKKLGESRIAARKLRAAENAAEDAADELADAVRRLEKAGSEEAIAKATEAKATAEAVLSDARTNGQALIAKATEAKTRADTVWTEAQKVADEGLIVEAKEARARAEAALAWTQTAADTRIVRATDTKGRAEAALAEAQKVREERIAQATEGKAQAEAALAEARKAVEEARAAKDAVQHELAAARKTADDARAAGRTAMATIEEARRRLKPLSVFISRKTGRLYVRQNFHPLFDVPVSIRDADRQIGTHVYVSTGATDDGSALRWQAVSMPVVVEIPPLPSHRRGPHAEHDAQQGAAPPPGPETAQGALDRLIIPANTMRRLDALTWVGASVIISDYGMSGETDSSTDFIILTRSKPRTR